MFEFRIDLQPSLDLVIRELQSAVDDEREKVLKSIADYAPDEIRKLMDSATRSGKTGYRAGGGSFIRSAAGEIPAKGSFELYDLLAAEMQGDDSILLTFASHAFYLDPLFEGMGQGAGYLNRPFIEQGIESAVKKLETL
jgi:hypothetical protein